MHHLLITAHAASVTRPPHGVAIKSQQSQTGLLAFSFLAIASAVLPTYHWLNSQDAP